MLNSHIIQVFRNQASNQKLEVQVILLTSTKKVHQCRPPYMGMSPKYGGHHLLWVDALLFNAVKRLRCNSDSLLQIERSHQAMHFHCKPILFR